MLICQTLVTKIEETRTETTHKWINQAKRICKKLPWPLSVLCKIVTTAVQIIEEIVYIVIKTFVTILCYFYQAIFLLIGLLVRIILELWIRSLGIVDLLLGFIGILPLKILRIHVVILRRRDGSVTAPEPRISLSIQRASEIFRDRARVKLVHTVHVLGDPAPEAALRVKSGFGSAFDAASDAGAYFQFVIANDLGSLLPAFWLRIAPPIVVFVTDGVGGSDTTGCSAGPLTDYVCVEGARMIVLPQYEPVTSSTPAEPIGALPALASDTLAHELAHACGLPHDLWDTTNLLYPNEFVNGFKRGTNLSPLQRGIIRGSAHVSYF